VGLLRITIGQVHGLKADGDLEIAEKDKEEETIHPVQYPTKLPSR
jgi:hypothetical protein